jgi:N-methylhydantoinase A
LVGLLCGRSEILTLDFGGTSADMGLIHEGRAALAAEKQVEGWPVQFAAVDVTAIGTGGGSIAALDRAGALRVGPRSAGAVPGPACYGRGGREPTVTDALLVLGILTANYFLGGELKLDRPAAEAAIRGRVAEPMGLSLHDAAGGIVQIANAQMLQALREVTLNRGFDVRDFTLLAYGGAGPLHATTLARELGCAGAIVPVHPGVFSALGMLTADLKYDLARTSLRPLLAAGREELDATLQEMAEEGTRRLSRLGSGEVAVRRSADLRYRGQEYTLNVPLPDGEIDPAELGRRFEETHQLFYGYTLPDEVWLVALRTVVAASLPRPRLRTLGPPADEAVKGQRRVHLPEERGWVEVPVYDRHRLGTGATVPGPAIVEERQSTTLLLPGDFATVDPYGNLLIDLGGSRG